MSIHHFNMVSLRDTGFQGRCGFYQHGVPDGTRFAAFCINADSHHLIVRPPHSGNAVSFYQHGVPNGTRNAAFCVNTDSHHLIVRTPYSGNAVGRVIALAERYHKLVCEDGQLF
jgi:hypothetical protein